MPTAKEEIRPRLIPVTAWYEDAPDHIYIRKKLGRGLEHIAPGRLVNQEEVERWLAKWIATNA